MPEMELIYFNGAGRAEATRILLHASGTAFTDTRINGADWPTKIKPTTPLGFLPVLKVDGKSYCQSGALLRFAAKKAGWYPKDDLEAMTVDEVFDTVNDLIGKIPKSDEKARKEYETGPLTDVAKYLEEKIQANGGTYVVGKSPTMADLVIRGIVKTIQSGQFDHINKEFFDASYPGIMATENAVSENEQVKAYYSSKE